MIAVMPHSPALKTPRTVREVLRSAAARLGGDSPRRDAELLLAHVAQHPRSWLYAHADEPLADSTQRAFEALCDCRAAGEPVAYLLGRAGFWSLEFEVAPGVLIPRPETERLVELVLERLPGQAPVRVADLGTGSGAVAVAIARERPLARVIAVEASPEALKLARANIEHLAPGRVDLRPGDWLAPLAGERFDLIAGNPPYLAADDPHLRQGDLRFEPRTALAAGNDGLDAIRLIAAQAPAHLRPGGWLLLEHGWTQGAAVRELFVAAGLVEVATARDLEDRERVTMGRDAAGRAA